jgi:hypothetical protein
VVVPVSVVNLLVTVTGPAAETGAENAPIIIAKTAMIAIAPVNLLLLFMLLCLLLGMLR